MKRVLIISHHALPLDIIASYRANAYLKHLKKFGYHPTLVTHQWGENQTSPVEHDYGNIIRIPEVKCPWWVQVFTTLEKLPILNKLSIVFRWLCGYLDPHPSKDLLSYLAFKKYLMVHLTSNNYDIMVGIFSPHHHLKLCHELYLQFKIPYLLDFRDLWHNRVIHEQYQPNITEKIQDTLVKYYWQKWLSKALFFSITSEAWRNKIAEFSSTKGVIITNGYDAEDFEVEPIQEQNKFRIIYAGRLYSHQYLEVFLTGYQQFAATRKTVDFELLFYGSKRSGLPNEVSGFLFEPEKYVSGYVDKAFYSFEERIPKKELIAILKGSQALLFPGMPASPGTHLGKIFDYLASHVNILLTPDDNDVVRDLIRKTKTGQIANTSEEVCHQLTKWYEEWQESGEVKWNGDKEEINKYSRESQVKKFASLINQI